ncbi:RrF2 family transcriptional regulator [Ammonifex thiophilus]|uniref:Rrf2 family transcriptional regulator n=1 Tax=Ammonifex thiophilus TaxID=444093 RepID=A0A3D8P6G3_9THEO|nr:Rrf2 family transcriptional regulator [Ammonifex thiophilus]RDV84923.1 Rrf2 family transcriptional regulator [Ammonifex thiophilus]
MRLSQAADYAMRVVLNLALRPPGEVVRAQVLAKEESIPLRFLLKIVRDLIRAGIVRSYRGVGGGFALARPAARITLREVWEAVEGPIRLNRCFIDPEYCSKKWAHECPVHEVLGRIQHLLLEELERYDFATLAAKVREPRETCAREGRSQWMP